jgi:Xaa-Pro aminopeptidase
VEFNPMDTKGRLGRLLERLDAADCEALLVTNLVNIRYLTGFSGSAAMLLVGPDGLLLTTDGRYKFQSAEQLEAAAVDAEIAIGALAAQREALAKAATSFGRVGLEAANVSWPHHPSSPADVFPSAELVPTESVVEGLRRVKDAGELDRIAAACHVADQALARVRSLLTTGVSEADFALALDVEIRRLGASGNSFESIVASGPNGAKPHARPSSRTIVPGELIVLDFGSLVEGYCSDMTRTVCVGEPSSGVARRMYDVVLESQRAGVAAVRPGVDCAAVDRACRDVIADAGWAEAFLHSTGHGVGLDIHEAPAVSAISADRLEVGQVVTVEPGVYLPEHGGVRIEDTVAVTEDGCRVLTNAPKELLV